MAKTQNEFCSIARTLTVVGERWTFLVLREAFTGRTRFAEFRDALGVAADVLTDRLNKLVDHGVMVKVPYKEEGARERFEYQLTDAGQELLVVLGAMQQWGDDHMPPDRGPTMARVSAKTGRPLSVAFVDDRNKVVSDPTFIKTAAYPA